MKAAIFKGKNTIEVGQRPDPQIQNPTDAIVRVVRGCVCGSDLWYYRGINQHKVGSIGHEYIGVVEAVGDDVTTLAVGDFVIAPFTYNDGTCPACLAGFQSNCVHGGAFGDGETDGGQGEQVRAPYADATLVKVPGAEADFTDEQLASFTALSDVTCTGYHAAVSAGVKEGDTVAVVGDGAVGLSAVLAAKKLGAGRIIALAAIPPVRPWQRSSVPPTSSRNVGTTLSRQCCDSLTELAWTLPSSESAPTSPSRHAPASSGLAGWSERLASPSTRSSSTKRCSGTISASR